MKVLHSGKMPMFSLYWVVAKYQRTFFVFQFAFPQCQCTLRTVCDFTTLYTISLPLLFWQFWINSMWLLLTNTCMMITKPRHNRQYIFKLLVSLSFMFTITSPEDVHCKRFRSHPVTQSTLSLFHVPASLFSPRVKFQIEVG